MEEKESCAVRASSPACTLVAEMCGLFDPLSIAFCPLSSYESAETDITV